MISKLIANRWIFVPIVLLTVSVSLGTLTVVLAVASHPLGVEPGYDEKAAHFQREIDQTATNDRLRWLLTSAIERLDATRGGIRLHIEDRNTNAIDAALITVECVPLANADLRHQVKLIEALPGEYSGTFSVPCKGIYEFFVHVQRGEDIYTDRFRRTLAQVQP